jgi:hypothetical protein
MRLNEIEKWEKFSLPALCKKKNSYQYVRDASPKKNPPHVDYPLTLMESTNIAVVVNERERDGWFV